MPAFEQKRDQMIEHLQETLNANSAVRLDEAVTACRNALNEWTRERVPLQCRAAT